MHFKCFLQYKRAERLRWIRNPITYGQIVAILDEEKDMDPKLNPKRTSSWRNPLGISHSTYLRMMQDLKMCPYNKVTVKILSFLTIS